VSALSSWLPDAFQSLYQYSVAIVTFDPTELRYRINIIGHTVAISARSIMTSAGQQKQCQSRCAQQNRHSLVDATQYRMALIYIQANFPSIRVSMDVQSPTRDRRTFCCDTNNGVTRVRGSTRSQQRSEVQVRSLDIISHGFTRGTSLYDGSQDTHPSALYYTA
jgi:hypothetical protein